ncbi:hypothetical protein AKJ16_DCAP16225 [Drosera capensis]
MIGEYAWGAAIYKSLVDGIIKYKAFERKMSTMKSKKKVEDEEKPPIIPYFKGCAAYALKPVYCLVGKDINFLLTNEAITDNLINCCFWRTEIMGHIASKAKDDDEKWSRDNLSRKLKVTAKPLDEGIHQGEGPESMSYMRSSTKWS